MFRIILVVPLLVLCSSVCACAGGLDPTWESGILSDSQLVVAPAGSPEPSPLDTVWSDIEEVATDVADLFTRPARWGTDEWAETAMGALLVGTCTAFDETVRDNVARSALERRTELAELGNVMGQVVPGAAVGVSTYAIGLVFDLPYVRRAGRHLLQSAVYASALTLVLKSSIGRHRPSLDHGQYQCTPFTLKDEFNSFPSGHATLVFAIASSLSADIDFVPATIILYSLAGVTAWSRIYDDRHWGSDVVMGSIIGTVVGHAVAAMDDGKDHGSATSGRLHIVPSLNGIGVLATW